MNKRYVVPWSWSNKSISAELDSPLDTLRGRANRLFEDIFSGFDLAPISGLTEKLGSFTPRISLCDEAQRFRVTAELPGVDLADVDISLTKESLTIRGEKREEREQRDSDTRYYTERTFGSFTRVIPLTADVDEDAVDASFDRGVLTILLPKAETSQKTARKISVRVK